MTHCEKCNIVHVNLECPLCAVKATLEKIRIVVKASPLMLKALKEIVEESKTGFVPSPSKDRMRAIAQAAIDAAEGKEGE